MLSLDEVRLKLTDDISRDLTCRFYIWQKRDGFQIQGLPQCANVSNKRCTIAPEVSLEMDRRKNLARAQTQRGMHAWAWRAATAAPRARDGLREEVAMPAASARAPGGQRHGRGGRGLRGGKVSALARSPRSRRRRPKSMVLRATREAAEAAKLKWPLARRALSGDR